MKYFDKAKELHDKQYKMHWSNFKILMRKIYWKIKSLKKED